MSAKCLNSPLLIVVVVLVVMAFFYAYKSNQQDRFFIGPSYIRNQYPVQSIMPLGYHQQTQLTANGRLTAGQLPTVDNIPLAVSGQLASFKQTPMTEQACLAQNAMYQDYRDCVLRLRD